MNIDQIKRDIKDATPQMLEALGIQRDRASRKWWCPFCKPDPSSKHGGSLGCKSGAMCCFRCGWRGDVIKLYCETRNVGFLEALEAMSKGKFKGAVNYSKIAPKVAADKPRKYYDTLMDAITALGYALNTHHFTRHWEYREMDGTLFMAVARFDKIGGGGKEYRPITRDEKGWYIGRSRHKLPLYNLPAIVNSFDETVTICEGEKAADAAISIGLLATCCAGGANAVDGSDWEPLRNRRILVFPDNDKAGETFALDVQKKLPQAVIMRIPGLPQKGDMYDWVEAKKQEGKTKEQMLDELRRIWKEQRQ